MKNPLLIAGLAAALGAATAGPALAQSADLHTWTTAGDVLIDAANAARLTTAWSDEAPLSAGAALLFDELEAALSLQPGSLPGDTLEGAGLQQSFVAAAGTRVHFDWQLETVDFDANQADQAFVLIDGSALSLLGTVAPQAVSGRFSHTFASAGPHALAIVVMDVLAADRVSTLTLSNFSVGVVPEPGQWALCLAGLGMLGLRLRRRD